MTFVLQKGEIIVENKKHRGTFSNIGFILAAAGSAVGLGNLWKFPYLTGQNGGGAFVFIYLLLVVLIGFTVMLGEMTIGRHTKLNPIGAYRKIKKKWAFVGVIGVIVPFTIVTYYSVIGGWILKYLINYIIGQGSVMAADSANYFESFITNPTQPLLWHGIFMLLNILIVARGVEGGLEKASKIMMPGLFVLLAILAIRSVTLPGAGEGISFYLKPDFSKVTIDMLVAALGQVFFSLSLGMGAIITYGSYLSDDANLEKSAFIIPALDTLVALLAGFAILPAVFSFGFEPSAGPGLIFITLPAVFNAMPLGTIFAIIFFVLVLFAAITSSISLLETPAAYFIDHFGMSRKSAVILLGIAAFLIGVPSSLSLGVFKTQFYGMSFFDLAGYIAESLLMPLAGFFMCIFVGYVWKPENAIAEITNGGKLPFKTRAYWVFMIKYIAPIAIFIIWLNSSGIVKIFTGK